MTTSSIPTSQVSPASPNHPSPMDHPLDVPTHSGDMDMRAHSENEGITTPPPPMVHIRALIISGDSHVFSFEPETTVGRVKELIWSMWPSQWTAPAQPPSPSFMRILYAGRVLSDESTLASNNLPTSLSPSSPTVVHISVRSFSMRAEDPEEPKKPSLLHPVRSRHTAADDDVGGCKCVIM